jgi:hypothetical protein
VECPLLGDEPPFLPGTSTGLKTLLLLFHIQFFYRLFGNNIGKPMHRHLSFII